MLSRNHWQAAKCGTVEMVSKIIFCSQGWTRRLYLLSLEQVGPREQPEVVARGDNVVSVTMKSKPFLSSYLPKETISGPIKYRSSCKKRRFSKNHISGGNNCRISEAADEQRRCRIDSEAAAQRLHIGACSTGRVPGRTAVVTRRNDAAECEVRGEWKTSAVNRGIYVPVNSNWAEDRIEGFCKF